MSSGFDGSGHRSVADRDLPNSLRNSVRIFFALQARLVKLGKLEVEGKRCTNHVVIDAGKVRKRRKGPSKQFREKFGHTPLSAGEEIPWGGKRLIGTRAHGALSVMDEVLAEAKRRSIEVIAAPTSEVCQLLEAVKKGQAYAILHCTC